MGSSVTLPGKAPLGLRAMATAPISTVAGVPRADRNIRVSAALNGNSSGYPAIDNLCEIGRNNISVGKELLVDLLTLS